MVSKVRNFWLCVFSGVVATTLISGGGERREKKRRGEVVLDDAGSGNCGRRPGFQLVLYMISHCKYIYLVVAHNGKLKIMILINLKCMRWNSKL